jgi:hypothetical protein
MTMRKLQLTQLPPFGINAVSDRGRVRVTFTTQSGEQIGADLSEDAAVALRMQLSAALDAIDAGTPSKAKATSTARGKKP